MSLMLTNIVLTRANRRLVDDVSLTISLGKLTVLMGENGAGKSSLLKIAAGELTPDRGEVRLSDETNHKDSNDMPMTALVRWPARERAKRLAVLPQETNVAFMFAAGQRRK